MKLVGLLLGVFGSVSIAMVGLVHLRKHDITEEEKANHFQEVKLRVTVEVLEEYKKEVIRVHRLLDKTKSTVFALEAELTAFRDVRMVKEATLEECQGKKKRFTDQVAAAELDKQRISSVIDEQQRDLTPQLQSLKDSLEQRSKLCDFIKKDSAKARKLCKEDLKAEPPKVDAPKEEPKVDAPKEEPKVDAPKEEPKGDTPKEEPKGHAPKEQPKVDAPKEEPKGDAPEEQPKGDAPKEQPKVDAPKEVPKMDAPKEVPKGDAPKEEPKPKEPKQA